ncbi:hypothetical protein EXIGLDRAFT_776397 [Exidia glandulosa HHB12029]|uniref:DUF5648 domain-containing protein n=1 Tax=Exidia glandulosa HHB12029 TaxID=1314781 RepID=A0A165DHV4_EXIGL|nr:hypothetical protein EXIGLDRAFT_776397 [Exidia glandulosa HHB12029]
MVSFFASLSVLALFTAAALAQEIPCRPDTPVTFYRIFSAAGRLGPFTGANDHMYTTSMDEVNAAFPRYILENDCCKVYKNSTKPQPPPVGGGFPAPDPYDLIPLYRLYTPKWEEDHWYTTSKLENDRAVAAGDISEGIVAWIRGAPGCGTIPMWRFFGDDGSYNGRDHMLVTDPSERAGLIAGGRYTEEFIVGYVWPA